MRVSRLSSVSRAQLKAWKKTIGLVLKGIKVKPQNLEFVKRIETNLNSILERDFSAYSTATLVLWALHLFHMDYLMETTRANHFLGRVSAEALVNALKYGRQEDLGPSRSGNYQRCLEEASRSHPELLSLVLLKVRIKWIYEKAKIVDSEDPSYIEKMQGVTESMSNVVQRWEEVEPFKADPIDVISESVIAFLNEPTNYAKEISMARDALDPIWHAVYNFRFSSLLEVLSTLKNYCDEQSQGRGFHSYIGRIEGRAIKQLCSLPESESQLVIDFVTWTKEKITDLESRGLDPTKLLMTCSLVKY